MNKSAITVGIGICVASIQSSAQAEKKLNPVTRQPNILFILVDDLGKEWISTYGAEEVITPNIDALARTGLKFNNFYSTPQSSPSRVTLLTGQYPFRHGWVNHWDVPRWGGGIHFDWNKNPSIARVLKSSGYKTAAVGKWQINDFRIQPEAMGFHGFDDYCMWTGYEANNPPSAERYWDPYIHTKAGSKVYTDQFGEDVFSDFLIDFMKKNKNYPMFLYYAMCLTHTPFTNTPLEPNVKGNLDCHKAMVRYMDFIIGKLVKALDDSGLREQTIIMYTTDNGTVGGITGKMNGRLVPGGKTKTTENGVCEPFIVNCPGMIPIGKVTEALGDLTDILPTCAKLAGASLPEGFIFDGVSLVDVLFGKTDESSRKWIMAMGGNGVGSGASRSEKGVENEYVYRDRVIRNKEYKLFISSDREPVKMVKVANDPEESVNLLDSPDYGNKSVFRELWEEACRFPARDNDPIYSPLSPQPWDVEITVRSQIWKK